MNLPARSTIKLAVKREIAKEAVIQDFGLESHIMTDEDDFEANCYDSW